MTGERNGSFVGMRIYNVSRVNLPTAVLSCKNLAGTVLEANEDCSNEEFVTNGLGCDMA
jgi:hypothetical protein